MDSVHEQKLPKNLVTLFEVNILENVLYRYIYTRTRNCFGFHLVLVGNFALYN